ENKGDVGYAGIAERANIGDAASSTAPRAVPANDDLQGHAVGVAPGVHGGDVDVERGVVLGDLGPDVVNGGQLGRAEGAGVAVGVEGGRGDVGPRAPLRLDVSREVQVQRRRGARQAVVDRGDQGGGHHPVFQGLHGQRDPALWVR